MSDLPPVPALEVFYSPICAPCKLELPFLATLIEDTSFNLVIVVLGDKERALADFRAVSPTLEPRAIVPDIIDERTALRAVGNSNGVLPYARVTQNADNICASWRGRLNGAIVKRMIARCRGNTTIE